MHGEETIVIQPISLSQSKSAQIAAHLRELIIVGKLAPGANLVIDTLAAEFGVSPIPVREALRQLDADGFIEIIPYVGTRVTSIKPNSIREVFGLLEAIEIISGQAACDTLEQEDFEVLERMIAEMDQLIDQPDVWSQRNREFHRFICERSGTHMILKMLDMVFDHWERLRRFYLDDVFRHRIVYAQQDHVALLSALRQRDPELVRLSIRYHNHTALLSYLALHEPQQAALSDVSVDESAHLFD
jgi:DNA-binding GntR family transcriptional regulator